MSTSALPIIVGGFYRSGTSLVRRLLDAHSRIHCPTEIKFLPDFYGLHAGSDPLAHIRFFTTVRALDLPESELVEVYGRAYRDVRERALVRRHKARWADKVPENVLYLDTWREILPQGFVFVHVVRDPLDVLGSLEEAGFRKTVPAAIDERIALYRRFREAGESWAARHPAHSVEIGYEALVAEPERALRSLFAFLGETFEPQVMTAFADAARGSGIEDPKVAATRAIHSESVGRSRRHLTPDNAELARNALARWCLHP